jgi:hypothetical protein
MLWLNNTNASGPWLVKLILVSSSGVTNLASLAVGIDNGTASTDQVVGLVGAITQDTGAYVRLDANTAGKIYLTQAVSVLAQTSSLAIEIQATDSSDEPAYITTYANLSVT